MYTMNIVSLYKSDDCMVRSEQPVLVRDEYERSTGTTGYKSEERGAPTQ